MKNIIDKIRKNEWTYYIVIILIALVLCAPLYTRGFIESHDGIYHFSRNYATNKAILSGQVPPMIVSNFCKGFGYGWNIFYPPLETYISGFFFVILFTFRCNEINNNVSNDYSRNFNV